VGNHPFYTRSYAAGAGAWAANAIPNVQVPQSVTINFGLGIGEIWSIIVYSTQDDTSAGPPSPGATFNSLGCVDFHIDAYDGRDWYTVATVANNNQVARSVNFADYGGPVNTDAIRVVVTRQAGNNYAQIVGVEAWGVGPTDISAQAYSVISQTYLAGTTQPIWNGIGTAYPTQAMAQAVANDLNANAGNCYIPNTPLPVYYVQSKVHAASFFAEQWQTVAVGMI